MRPRDSAREHQIPCLGLCLGMQVMTIEYARNALGLAGANSTEFDIRTPHPVIDLMESQRDVTDMGGTMRLGAYVAQLKPGSRVAQAYGEEVVSRSAIVIATSSTPSTEPGSRTVISCLSGESPDGRLVEFIELDGHPFWIATQAHPEFKSRPDRPAPLFREFVAAALESRRRVATRGCRRFEGDLSRPRPSRDHEPGSTSPSGFTHRR